MFDMQPGMGLLVNLAPLSRRQILWGFGPDSRAAVYVTGGVVATLQAVASINSADQSGESEPRPPRFRRL